MYKGIFILLCVLNVNYGIIVEKTKYVNTKKVNTPRVKLAVNKLVSNKYDPQNVDWNGVISGCRAACRYEKRLCNFYIRAAAHDSMSISESVGGADGSLLLTEDELSRIENNHDNFAYIVSKNALALAKKYDASVADIIAVCGAVATQYLGGPDIISYTKIQPFMVGRLDKTVPNPANTLAPANLNTSGFVTFAEKRNLTIDEMTALMGSHSLLDTKGCLTKSNTYCDPNKESCDKISMFTWDNSYYNDVCNTDSIIYPNMTMLNVTKNRVFEVNSELCKYTSTFFRNKVKMDVQTEIPQGDANGMFQEIMFTMIETVKANALGLKTWLFTVHDGWMGMACQNKLINTPYNMDIGVKMRKFKNNRTEWNISYKRGYKKMVNIGATWVFGKGYPITGFECNSGYISSVKGTNCKNCNVNYENILSFKCPSSCYCKTSFNENDAFYY